MEDPQPSTGPSPPAPMEVRIQQLQNRLFLLQKMKNVKNKAEDSSDGTTVEITSEDSDDLCELEVIQMELHQLLLKKEEMEEEGQSSTLTQEDSHPTSYKSDTPYGGIYTLPPFNLTQQEGVKQEQPERTATLTEIPIDRVVPVDSLGPTPDLTQCPTCQEVVFTQTQLVVGETVWIVCCLCVMIGGVAGCCAIPFFTKSLMDVHHHCPRCKAHIYTYRPF